MLGRALRVAAAVFVTVLIGLPALAVAVVADKPADGAHVGPQPALAWTLEDGESSVRAVVLDSTGARAWTRALDPEQTAVTVDRPLDPGVYSWRIEARRFLVVETETATRSFTVDPVPTPSPAPTPVATATAQPAPSATAAPSATPAPTPTPAPARQPAPAAPRPATGAADARARRRAERAERRRAAALGERRAALRRHRVAERRAEELAERHAAARRAAERRAAERREAARRAAERRRRSKRRRPAPRSFLDARLEVAPLGAFPPATVSGVLAPVRAGHRVRIDIKTAAGWQQLGEVRTHAWGTYSYPLTWAPPAGTVLRVRFGGSTRAAAKSVVVGSASPVPYAATTARWLAAGRYGERSACGRTLARDALGTAHRTLPCGTRVTFMAGARTLHAFVVDRGSHVAADTWQLSDEVRRQLGLMTPGAVWAAVWQGRRR